MFGCISWGSLAIGMMMGSCGKRRSVDTFVSIAALLVKRTGVGLNSIQTPTTNIRISPSRSSGAPPFQEIRQKFRPPTSKRGLKPWPWPACREYAGANFEHGLINKIRDKARPQTPLCLKKGAPTIVRREMSS